MPSSSFRSTMTNVSIGGDDDDVANDSDRDTNIDGNTGNINRGNDEHRRVCEKLRRLNLATSILYYQNRNQVFAVSFIFLVPP